MWVEITDDGGVITGLLHAEPGEGNHFERIDALRRVANAILEKEWVYQIRRLPAGVDMGREDQYGFYCHKHMQPRAIGSFPRHDHHLGLIVEYEGPPTRVGS